MTTLSADTHLSRLSAAKYRLWLLFENRISTKDMKRLQTELEPDVWMRLATGITSWAEEKEAGRITAVGERDDLSDLLPLV